MTNKRNTEQQSFRPAAFMAVAALSALVGFGAVYGTLPGHDNKAGGEGGSAQMTPRPQGRAVRPRTGVFLQPSSRKRRLRTSRR